MWRESGVYLNAILGRRSCHGFLSHSNHINLLPLLLCAGLDALLLTCCARYLSQKASIC